MGKSVDDEIKEKAFQLWRKCGRSPDRVVKELRAEGHMVTRQSIDTWKNERNWEGRAARADLQERQAKDAQINHTETLLADLEEARQRYKRFFETLGKTGVDNQAQYAYNNILVTITDIKKKLDEKPDLFRMTPLVMDAFVQFIKKVEKDPAQQAPVFALIDRFFDEVKPDGV